MPLMYPMKNVEYELVEKKGKKWRKKMEIIFLLYTDYDMYCGSHQFW